MKAYSAIKIGFWRGGAWVELFLEFPIDDGPPVARLNSGEAVSTLDLVSWGDDVRCISLGPVPVSYPIDPDGRRVNIDGAAVDLLEAVQGSNMVDMLSRLSGHEFADAGDVQFIRRWQDDAIGALCVDFQRLGVVDPFDHVAGAWIDGRDIVAGFLGPGLGDGVN
jgi:hypothetical protein